MCVHDFIPRSTPQIMSLEKQTTKMKGGKERGDNKQRGNRLNNSNEKLCSVHRRTPSCVWSVSGVAVQSGEIRRMLDRKQTQGVAKDGMDAGGDRQR